MDATCNGYQHLSMLGSDVELATHLNLNISSTDELPKDFYSFIVQSVRNYFENQILQDKLDHSTQDSYKRILSLSTDRSLVKKAIMTIPYNVSIISLMKYLRDSFVYDTDFTLERNTLNKNENKKVEY